MQDNRLLELLGFSTPPSDWTEMDEQMEREGNAIKKSFHSTAVRGTPRQKSRVAGGPKNRERRKGLVHTG